MSRPAEPGAAPCVPPVPLATYRLQLHAGFTLRDAAALVPYLHSLGITHLYCSPFLKARRGSQHGYDVTDHGALNPEVGDEADLEHLVAELASRGMGQVLDFVPNHVGIGQGENARWIDVLEHGPDSPCAADFDIDWRPAKVELRGKVLLPFLGDHYGRVLERGELRIEYDLADERFAARYYEQRFPLERRSCARLLEEGLPALRAALPSGHSAPAELGRIVGELRARGSRPAARARAESARRALAALAREQPVVRRWLEQRARELAGTPGQPRSFRRLHRLLEAQHWRLAYWRVAADEINYRRFFDINELVGLRIEQRELFERTHQLVFRWIDEGKAHGLRIDHIDGLYDPRGYCQRLRARAGARPLWIVVEKILAPHERLRGDWPIAGTTGYDFMNELNGLLVDPKGEAPLLDVYRRFVGSAVDFDQTLYACKKHVMNFLLGSELQMLANELDRLSERAWLTRDFTLISLKEALKEVVACFQVYRTYVDERGATPEDRREIDRAFEEARRRSSDPEPTLYDWLHGVLTGDIAREKDSAWSLREVVRFARKFQQFSGPVMAKSLEDTASYRDFRLLALNEVGGDPRKFGLTTGALHAALAERARDWPHAMLATSTHDTKRGEDVRARLDVLSELPHEWSARVERWAELNRPLRRSVGGQPAPVPNDEYFLYQTLLGSWPVELADSASLDATGLADYRARLEGYLVKALREGKLHSSWRHPDADYEEAALDFLRALLDPQRGRGFLRDFLPFWQRVAALGALNSLCQQLVKLTAPGVPDTHQGCELWDLSLADPDNRRPVDFALRARLLAELETEFAAAPDARASCLRAWLGAWPDARAKLWLVARLLRFRREQPELLLDGDYLPLEPGGSFPGELFAFARVRNDAQLVVVAPLRWSRIVPPSGGPLPDPAVWQDAYLDLPGAHARGYRDVISGIETPCVTGPGGGLRLPLASLLRALPLAALVPLRAERA